MTNSIIERIHNGDGRKKRSWANTLYGNLKGVLTNEGYKNHVFEVAFLTMSPQEQVEYVNRAIDTLSHVQGFQNHSSRLAKLKFEYLNGSALASEHGIEVVGVYTVPLEKGNFAMVSLYHKGFERETNANSALREQDSPSWMIVGGDTSYMPESRKILAVVKGGELVKPGNLSRKIASDIWPLKPLDNLGNLVDNYNARAA